jgi:hypothetical protein
VLRLQLACCRVFLIDSVKGDGTSVKDLSTAIYEQVIQLPMMSEQIPRLWASIRKIVQQSYEGLEGPLAGRLVLQREEAISLLRPAVPGLSDESLWDALVFWGTLGDVVVSSDVLVTDIKTLIKLFRPILHHAPLESLRRMAKKEGFQCDEVVVPDFADLMKDKQDDIRMWIKELVDKRLLRFAVLEHMSCWKDLKEEERINTTKVLEACYLIVREHDGSKLGSNSPSTDKPTKNSSWLVTCRFDRVVPEDSKGPVKLDNLQAELGFQARARFVPSGFFSTLQAFQLVHNTQSWLLTTTKVQADSSNLKMSFRTMFGKGWENVSVMLTKCNRNCVSDAYQTGEGELMAIEVWSTSLAMLKNICSDIDRIRQDKFPGISFQHVVWFRNDKFSEEALEWQLERNTGSLTTILEQRIMTLQITAEEWNSKNKIEGMVLQDAIRTVQAKAAFFLSHAWGDWSVRERARRKVTEGLQLAVEKQSGELVWIDTAELKNETQFHRQMEQGIKHAQCVVICLSYIYLTRPNCLWELCWAVQGYVVSGKRLVVVSVDPLLTFEAITRWDISQNLTIRAKSNKDEDVVITVDKRTLTFVRKWFFGIKLYEQWKDGEGAWSKERQAAVEEMLKSVRAQHQDSDFESDRSVPSLKVDKEGGSWFVLES